MLDSLRSGRSRRRSYLLGSICARPWITCETLAFSVTKRMCNRMPGWMFLRKGLNAAVQRPRVPYRSVEIEELSMSFVKATTR